MIRKQNWTGQRAAYVALAVLATAPFFAGLEAEAQETPAAPAAEAPAAPGARGDGAGDHGRRGHGRG